MKLRGRLSAWLLGRLQPAASWTLTQRNVYILPTAAGWAFAAMLLVMLVGSINYQLGLGFGLTFLLAGCGVVSMHLTHRTLVGLTLHLRPVAPVHAGQAATVEVVLANRAGVRESVGLRFHEDGPPAGPRSRPRARAAARVDAGARTGPGRGAAALHAGGTRAARRAPVVVDTRFPFGFFRAWSVWPAAQVLASPVPETPAPPLPGRAAGDGRQANPRPGGGSELDGVRAWRRGDTLRQVVWKKAARTGELGEPPDRRRREHRAVARVARRAGRARRCRGAAVAPGGLGRRLADRLGVPVGLRLPGVECPPAWATRTGGACWRRWPCGADPRRRPGGPRPAWLPTRLAAFVPARLPHWPGWQHLPRETRDTLFLLGVIAWVVAPHLAHLPPWCTLLVGGVMAWRAALALSGAPLPGRLPVAAVLALATGLTWWGERTLLGREAGVTMLVVLMALERWSCARGATRWWRCCWASSSCSRSSCVRSRWARLRPRCWRCGACSPRSCSRTCAAGRPPLRRAAGVAARVALLAAPLMLALFLLFPRIGPLWGLPQDAVGRSGLSGTLRLGGLAQVAEDDSVAIRLRFPDGPPPPQAMYFRGPVLSNFDGREWTRAERSPAQAPAGRRASCKLRGDPVRYEATFEPSRLAMLPLLELTPERPAEAPALDALGAAQRSDLPGASEQPLNERLRLRARAWPDHQRSRDDPWSLREYVEPAPGLQPARAGVGPRRCAAAAAGRAHRRASSPRRCWRTCARAASATPWSPGPMATHAGGRVLVRPPRGLLRRFATAFVVLMRALDVPARVVTGSRAATPCPWTATGWCARATPRRRPSTGTPPLAGCAPTRPRWRPTAASAAAATLPPRRASCRARCGAESALPLFARLRSAWEALDNRWNQAVLELLRAAASSTCCAAPRASSRPAGTTCCASSARPGGGRGAGRHGLGRGCEHLPAADPWTRLQRRVQQRLAQLGVAVRASDPPRTRAQRARAALGPAAEGLAAALEALERARYAPAAAGVPRRWWREFEEAARRAERSGDERRKDRRRGSRQARTRRRAQPGRDEGPHRHGRWRSAADCRHSRRGPRSGLQAPPPQQPQPRRPPLRPQRRAPPAAAGEKRGAASAKKRAGPPQKPASAPAEGPSYANRPEAAAFAAEVAQRRGLPADWVLAQLGQARRLAQVQRLIMPPPPGTAKNWAAYRARFIDPTRIDAGLRFWREHAPWLERAQARWGVPPEIVVGIIGVETLYGRMTGSFRALDALATLAFDFPPGDATAASSAARSSRSCSCWPHARAWSPAPGAAPRGALGLPPFMPGASTAGRWTSTATATSTCTAAPPTPSAASPTPRGLRLAQ
jgi:hypothetical protein